MDVSHFGLPWQGQSDEWRKAGNDMPTGHREQAGEQPPETKEIAAPLRTVWLAESQANAYYIYIRACM